MHNVNQLYNQARLDVEELLADLNGIATQMTAALESNKSPMDRPVFSFSDQKKLLDKIARTMAQHDIFCEIIDRCENKVLPVPEYIAPEQDKKVWGML